MLVHLRRGVAPASRRISIRFATTTQAAPATPSWAKPLLWAGVATSQVSLFYLFRDLADLSQWVVEPPRASTISTWRSQNLYSALTLAPMGLCATLKVCYPHVCSWRMLLAIGGWTGLLYFSSAINPHIMMRARNQVKDAVFLSQDEAKKLLPGGLEEPCIIIERDGKAVAYPDTQVLRPHVASGGDLGDDIVLTYCGLSNLGIAYTPELGGKRLDLHPMTQLENNLVMYDKNSMEPVQQLWGTTENRMECKCELNKVERMKEWPTYRLRLKDFCKAWPGAKVFVNDYSTKGLKPNFSDNPLLYLYDLLMDTIFSQSIIYQKTNEKPVFPTLKNFDSRLPSKELVYVVPLHGDAVAYSSAFLQEKKTVNVQIGGSKIVVAYFPEFSAIGAFYNTTGRPVKTLDFYGRMSDGKTLPRVETFKAGVFWCVWMNWFPLTDLNRSS